MTDAVRSALEEAREAISQVENPGQRQVVELLARIDAALAAPPAGGMADAEAIAEIVYHAMRYAAATPTNAPPAWIKGGNSSMQYLAREYAVRILAASPQPPVASPVAVKPLAETDPEFPNGAIENGRILLQHGLRADLPEIGRCFEYMADYLTKQPLYTAPPPAPGWNEAIEAAAKWHDDEAALLLALLDKGKGEHGKPGYVTDLVWNSWITRRDAHTSSAAAIRALTPPATGAQDAEKVEGDAEKRLRELIEAIDAKAVTMDSVEIQDQNPLNDPEPPHLWHEEWLHHARSALKREG